MNQNIKGVKVHWGLEEDDGQKLSTRECCGKGVQKGFERRGENEARLKFQLSGQWRQAQDLIP